MMGNGEELIASLEREKAMIALCRKMAQLRNRSLDGNQVI